MRRPVQREGTGDAHGLCNNGRAGVTRIRPTITTTSTIMRSQHPLSMSFARPALFLLLLGSLAQAQPNTEVTRLLFEPVPIPADPSTELRPLVSFKAAETALVPAAEQSRLTARERIELEDEIAHYLSVLGESEATEGPYAYSLHEDLLSVGKMYQRLERHPEAIRMFERSLNVARLNEGLRDIDQVPILEAMAESYEAMGRKSNADAMMDATVELANKTFGAGSSATAPYLARLGDWNTQAFMNRSSILLNIPRMNVQSFLLDPRNYMQNTDAELRQSPAFKLYEARGAYLNAIKSMIDARDYRNESLLELERKLLTNYFLSMHRENIVYEPDFYLSRKKSKTTSRLDRNAIELSTADEYDEGRKAHQRIQQYLKLDSPPRYYQLARALLEEADWDLLFRRARPSEDRYDKAYAYFHDDPARMTDEVRALLYPEVPVALPTFLPAPNSREKLGIAEDAEVNFFGYIDVRFELTRHGKARKIKILGKEGEVTRNMEIRLGQYLRKLQFRPRFVDGQRDTTPMELRYYIGI